MKNLKEVIESKIKERGYTKELIYSTIGMTKAGFDSALKSESLKLKHFQKLANLLSIEPNYFFDWGKEIIPGQINEPEEKYQFKKKNDTKSDTLSEIEYLRLQNDRLLRIIENFSLQIDTKSIS